MADVANYGTVLHGTRTITIYPAGTTVFGSPTVATATCIAEDISVDRPTNELSRPAADGTENGFVLIKRPTTISATLQLASAVTADLRGCLFKATIGAAEDVYVITNCGYSEAIGAEQKITIKAKSTTFV